MVMEITVEAHIDLKNPLNLGQGKWKRHAKDILFFFLVFFFFSLFLSFFFFWKTGRDDLLFTKMLMSNADLGRASGDHF